MQKVRLTQYSHGAGCGCKISPAVLDKILGSSEYTDDFDALLVGNNSKDDAAVMELNDDQVVISTTDFFMPIVDDAFDFGRIASANAISDIDGSKFHAATPAALLSGAAASVRNGFLRSERMTSPNTATAISAGLTEPISRPIGALIRPI